MISINIHTSSNIFSLKSNQTAKETLFPFFFSDTYFPKRFVIKRYISSNLLTKQLRLYSFFRKRGNNQSN